MLVTVICMLAQIRNEHSSKFQTTMCIYLLACGASWMQFDVLNHARFTLSYTAAIWKIKEFEQTVAVRDGLPASGHVFG